MSTFAPALPHGALTEVFQDVFVVTGRFRFGPGLTITRNMTVVREGNALTLVNSVRLSPQGESELAKLGVVKHLVRLGAFHGADDPYYKNRYKPILWAPPGIRHKAELTTDRELKPGASPIKKSRVFLFEKGKRPEAALVLERDGGILLTCDSYQHWTNFDGCSLLSKWMMKVMGFGPTVVGGPWAREMGPGVQEDFARLLGMPFKHLISGHGTVLRDEARPGLEIAVANRFGKR